MLVVVKRFFDKYWLWLGIAVLMALTALLVYEFYPRMSVVTAWACAEDKCDDKVLLLHGEVKGISADWVRLRLWRELKLNPDIKTVCISSRGGVSSEAMRIADNIYTHQRNTCLAKKYNLDSNGFKSISGICQSACTWMLLAGKERILYDGKVLMGFHGARSKMGGRADEELKMFNRKIAFYTHLRPKAEPEAWKLAGLTWWAFHQGSTAKTTNCTAHEVNKKYPYFTDVRSSLPVAPEKSCGLQGPYEVVRSFD